MTGRRSIDELSFQTMQRILSDAGRQLSLMRDEFAHSPGADAQKEREAVHKLLQNIGVLNGYNPSRLEDDGYRASVHEALGVLKRNAMPDESLRTTQAYGYYREVTKNPSVSRGIEVVERQTKQMDNAIDGQVARANERQWDNLHRPGLWDKIRHLVGTEMSGENRIVNKSPHPFPHSRG
jgi:hypothetical protein